MLGPGLKASIQTTTLTEGDTQFYFPKGQWCQIQPGLSATTCHNSPGDSTSKYSYRTHLEDYYIHLRNGYIVPIQANTGVMTTKNLLDQAIFLYMLPDSANSQRVTNFGTINAAAYGFIYYDDGLTLDQKVGRFDFYLVLNGDNSATMKVSQVKEGVRRNNAEENISQLLILQASQSKLQGATKAQAILANQPNPVPMTFRYTKTLDLITVTADPAQVAINFYDVTEIQILP